MNVQRRRGRVAAWLVACVLGLGLGGSDVVWAQGKGIGAQAKKPIAPASAPTVDPVMIEAEKHFDAGRVAAQANRWDTAREEFLKAFELKPDHAQIVARLAHSEIATGKNREAVEHLAVFLRDAKNVSAEDRQQAEALLVEAKSKLAVVTIRVNKPGAKVSVDGRPLGVSPLAQPEFVEAGKRQFVAEGVGERAQLDIELQATQPKTVELVMVAPVVVDPQKWRTGAILVGAGLSLAGLGVGVGFLVGASSKDADAAAKAAEIRVERNTNQPLCPPGSTDPRCDELLKLQGSRNTYGNAGLAGFVVGGVATAATLTIWLTTPKKPARVEKASVQVVPSLRGLLVMGTF